MTTFQQRALTAIIFAAVMLVGLFWNEYSFFLLFFVIAMGCLWEFYTLTIKDKISIKILGCLIAILAILNDFTFSINGSIISGWKETIWSPLLSINLLLILTLLSLFIIELFSKSENPFQSIGSIILGIFYISFPFYIVKTISFNFYGFINNFESLNSFTPNIVAGTLFLTWANDTFAYIIGSKIGKTPLLHRISPKKTWEGTIGGAVMCMLTGIAISYFFKELTLVNWMIVGGIVAVFGTLGDLIESMLKRSVGVKDSGSFMPGHGGFLDRFDAFIFAVPFVYLYLIVLK